MTYMSCLFKVDTWPKVYHVFFCVCEKWKQGRYLAQGVPFFMCVCVRACVCEMKNIWHMCYADDVVKYSSRIILKGHVIK